MDDIFKALLEGIEKNKEDDPLQLLLVKSGITLLQQFLTDHKRIADALEAIAINLEESNPDAPA